MKVDLGNKNNLIYTNVALAKQGSHANTNQTNTKSITILLSSSNNFINVHVVGQTQ